MQDNPANWIIWQTLMKDNPAKRQVGNDHTEMQKVKTFTLAAF